MIRHRRLFVVGAFVFGLIVALAVLAPVLADDPQAIPAGSSRLGPSTAHVFGTDLQGRDVFARVLFGARLSLTIGVLSAALSLFVGVAVGVFAAFRRGWVDSVLMRATDVWFVFPIVVLAAVLALALGRSVWTLVLAVGLAGWPQAARFVRSFLIQQRHSLFVEASRAGGLTEAAIFRSHILPRLLPLVAALFTIAVATGVLTESALSFLSMGIGEPHASWGVMIAGGKRFFETDPHMVLFPVLALALTVGSLVAIHESLSASQGDDEMFQR